MNDETAQHASQDLSAIAKRLRLESIADHAALERMSSLLDDPTLQVLERDVPVDVTALLTTAPDWGRGGSLAASIGPFAGTDGRRFWFDFLRLTRLVPVYVAGDTKPAVLFSIRQWPLRVGDSVPVLEILRLLQQRYTLGPGSVWIRADLLAAGAPPRSYVGLRIAEGHVSFTPRPVSTGGRLDHARRRTLCAGVVVRPAVDGTQHAHGRQRRRRRRPESPCDGDICPRWTPRRRDESGRRAVGALRSDNRLPLGQGGVPLRARSTRRTGSDDGIGGPARAFVRRIRARRHHRCGTDRPGRMAAPGRAIDVTKPPVAGGAGGLAALGGDGLFMTWTGLHDGPLRLPSPWFVLLPGVAGVLDRHADNIYAHQRFELWADAQSQFRSELALRWSDSFPVTFVSAAFGADVVVTTAAVDARLDRPVDVRGAPLAIHTLGSRLILTVTEVPGADPYRTVAIRDDDVLNDALQLAATSAVEAGGSMSLAIRNALFTTTPVATFTLAGHLPDPEVVDHGTVTLGFGLYGLLPTLPDPYAANVGWLLARPVFTPGRKRRRAPVGSRRLDAWTATSTTWRPSFSFAPVGRSGRHVPALGPGARTRHRRLAGRDMTSSIAATTSAQTTQPTYAHSPSWPGGSSADATWHAYFDVFEREQFALLDVSSNADQMGVSFAWQSPREADDRSRVAREFVTADTERRPRRLSVAGARSRPVGPEPLRARLHRAADQLGAAGQPHGHRTRLATRRLGFVLFPDDGGPTRLFNDAPTVVPIAPIPVLEHLESDFHERPHGFTGGLFTLPVRSSSLRRIQPHQPIHPAVRALVRKLAFNAKRFSDGALIGGLQLRVDAPENLPESAIFQGATAQLTNLLHPGRHADGNRRARRQRRRGVQRRVLPRTGGRARPRRAGDAHRLLGLRRQPVQPLGQPERRGGRHQPGPLRRVRRPHRTRGRSRSAASSTRGVCTSCAPSRCSAAATATRSVTTPAGRPRAPVSSTSATRPTSRASLRARQRRCPVRTCSTPAWCTASSTCATSTRRRRCLTFTDTWNKTIGDTTSTPTACSTSSIPERRRLTGRDRCTCNRSTSTPTSRSTASRRRFRRPGAVEGDARLRPAGTARRADLGGTVHQLPVRSSVRSAARSTA